MLRKYAPNGVLWASPASLNPRGCDALASIQATAMTWGAWVHGAPRYAPGMCGACGVPRVPGVCGMQWGTWDGQDVQDTGGAWGVCVAWGAQGTQDVWGTWGIQSGWGGWDAQDM